MSECGSFATRDVLPEYLHDRLGDAERAPIEAHLAECEECRLELAMLTSVRDAMWQKTPRIDAAAIVRALPRSQRRRAVRPWMLQLAAVLSFVSVGGVSLVVARSFYDSRTSAVSQDSVRSLSTIDSVLPGASTTLAVAAGRHALTVGGGVADLGLDELEQLLGALESIEARPSADPDELLAQDIPRAVGVR